MCSKTCLTYKEIETYVFKNEEILKKATLKELYEFAVLREFANSVFEFSKFKEALSEIGINYDEMKGNKK